MKAGRHNPMLNYESNQNKIQKIMDPSAIQILSLYFIEYGTVPNLCACLKLKNSKETKSSKNQYLTETCKSLSLISLSLKLKKFFLFYRPMNSNSILWKDEITGSVVQLFKDECQGQVLPGYELVNMTSIYDVTFCARRAGPNFLNTIRIDPRVEECPEGLQPCHKDKKAPETSCVSDLKECPILGI